MTSSTPNNIAKLLPFKDSVANTITLNTNRFQWKMYLEIPKDIAKDLTLLEVKDLGLETKQIDIETAIVRETTGTDIPRPWLIANLTYFNQEPGFHMVEFVFRNNNTNVYQSFYFSYTAQIDDPDKSYIYMNRTKF